MPAGAVEPEHDDAIPSRPGLTRKQRQQRGDTLQVPSNLAGSAKAEPDRMRATTDVLSMGSVPLLEDVGLPGFDLMGLEGR